MDLMSRLQTPVKHPQLVLSPSYRRGAFDSHGIDCPFLFFHDDQYWMTYVGWDGSGYQTGLASSRNLWDWEKEGLLLGRGPKGSPTENNLAMTSLLRDNELFGEGTLKRVEGRYVGTYHAYPDPGYECGPGVIGLCYSEDLRTWKIGSPALFPDPACSWEAGGLYKSWLMESEGRYYLFYNAKNRTDPPWVERTGFAISADLVQWERYPGNPVLGLGETGEFDDCFASDPCVLHHQGQWILFYFGLCSDGHARDGVAFSEDLRNWKKSGSILIDIGSEGSIDARHAHKPGIITRENRLYHFYCAVSPAGGRILGEIEHNEIRGIALAT